MPSALLQELEPSSSQSTAHVKAAKERAVRERRNDQEAVQRGLDEQFAGFSQMETDGVCIDNRTLRQTLLELVHANRSSKCRMPKAKIDELREAYCSEENLLKKLPRAEKTVPPTKELVEAMFMASHPNPAKRRREPMWSLLSTSTSLSRRDFLAILRSLIPLNPYGQATRHHMLECLRLIQLPAHRRHDRGELGLLSPIWDKALAADLAAHTHKGKSRESWWDSRTEALCALKEHEEIDGLLCSNRPLKVVHPDIQRLCKSSLVAQKMFANASLVMGKQNFKDALEAEIMALELNFVELRVQSFKAWTRTFAAPFFFFSFLS